MEVQNSGCSYLLFWINEIVSQDTFTGAGEILENFAGEFSGLLWTDGPSHSVSAEVIVCHWESNRTG